MATSHEIFRYSISGAINTIVGFICYSSTILLGHPYWVANFIAFIGGILCGYFLSKKFVFVSGQPVKNEQSVGKYVTVILGQYLIGTALIGQLIGWGANEILSYVLVLPIAIAVSFIFQKVWVFKSSS